MPNTSLIPNITTQISILPNITFAGRSLPRASLSPNHGLRPLAVRDELHPPSACHLLPPPPRMRKGDVTEALAWQVADRTQCLQNDNCTSKRTVTQEHARDAHIYKDTLDFARSRIHAPHARTHTQTHTFSHTPNTVKAAHHAP